MDFAMLGRPGADSCLVVLSATHGAEGFCGSGCQVALMHDDAFMRAIETSGAEVMMLHALNPYGFSHLRRVNEDNADLNRNFVDFTSPLPVNAAYAELHPLLLPAAWPPEPAGEAKLGAWLAAWRRGLPGRRQRRTVPVRRRYVLRRSRAVVVQPHAASIARAAATRSALAWIDSTGLGPRGLTR